jgi:hypothetical protein
MFDWFKKDDKTKESNKIVVPKTLQANQYLGNYVVAESREMSTIIYEGDVQTWLKSGTLNEFFYCHARMMKNMIGDSYIKASDSCILFNMHDTKGKSQMFRWNATPSAVTGNLSWYNDMLARVEDLSGLPIEEFTHGTFHYLSDLEMKEFLNKNYGSTTSVLFNMPYVGITYF